VCPNTIFLIQNFRLYFILAPLPYIHCPLNQGSFQGNNTIMIAEYELKECAPIIVTEDLFQEELLDL